MKIFSLFMLSLLVACGGSGGSSKGSNGGLKDRSQDPYSCQNPAVVANNPDLCRDKADWVIVSGQEFPRNFSIKYFVTYDGKELSSEVMDMCKGKQVSFSKSDSKNIAHFYQIPIFNEQDAVKLEITDRGEDCSNNAIFFSGYIPKLVISQDLHTKVLIDLFN